jgi:hypothetical protein
LIYFGIGRLLTSFYILNFTFYILRFQESLL